LRAVVYPIFAAAPAIHVDYKPPHRRIMKGDIVEKLDVSAYRIAVVDIATPHYSV
jgi:hypothetical protein